MSKVFQSRFNCGSCRDTLVVVFGFCPKILGGGDSTLSLGECRLNGHSNPTRCNHIFFNSLHSKADGILKHRSRAHSCPYACLHPPAQKPPCETLTFNSSIMLLEISKSISSKQVKRLVAEWGGGMGRGGRWKIECETNGKGEKWNTSKDLQLFNVVLLRT